MIRIRCENCGEYFVTSETAFGPAITVCCEAIDQSAFLGAWVAWKTYIPFVPVRTSLPELGS